MSVAETLQEPVEAVIISGPQKGRIVTLPVVDRDPTADEMVLLDQLEHAIARIREDAHIADDEARGILRELRAGRGTE